jgi:hypothetical protein
MYAGLCAWCQKNGGAFFGYNYVLDAIHARLQEVVADV